MKKKITSFLLMVSLLLTCFSVPAAASATASPAPKSLTLFRYTNGSKTTFETGHITTCRFAINAKNVKAVSSNTKIATVKILKSYLESGGEYYFKITPKKKGSCTITMSGTVDGKKVTEKTKVRIVDYKNPAASFKIDNTDYGKKFKKSNKASVTGKLVRGKKMKVSCKPAKGWTCEYIRKSYLSDFGPGEAYCIDMLQKNNTTITFSSEALSGEIEAAFYNKTLGKTAILTVKLK